MATNEQEKQTMGGFPIDATKVTTKQIIPSAADLEHIKALDKRIESVDLSDESINSSPSILALTRLGKTTTDNYLEQQKRNSRAGKFAAWSQFANALAAFAGGAANGQAMPIQQNYNLPMSSFQKADAYRDAMAQNQERYESAKISAQQNEKARRMQQLEMYYNERQKAIDNAFKNGTTVTSENDALGAAVKLSGMKNDEIRARASMMSADAAQRRARVQEERLNNSDKQERYTAIAAFPNDPDYGPLAGKYITSPMFHSLVAELGAMANEIPELNMELQNDSNYQKALSIGYNISDIKKDDVAWMIMYLKRFPERFEHFFDEETNPQFFFKNGSSKSGASKSTSDESWM